MQEEQLMGEHEGMHDGGTGGGKASELIIRPIEGKQTNFYYIKESGGKIGRHSVNEVVIYDESVSRHHAEITFMDNEFFLQDIGSTTGTYIKIEERLPLEPGMILEIGSYQFRVKNIVINKKAPNNGSPMMVIFHPITKFRPTKPARMIPATKVTFYLTFTTVLKILTNRSIFF